jgi:uncharacterized membrane protein YraQ (UPF0718 family)
VTLPARRLFDHGALGAAALIFMLAASAINPVVAVSTVVAFPRQPQMAFARIGASLLTAIIMGLAWSRWGNTAWINPTAAALVSRTPDMAQELMQGHWWDLTL